MPPNQPGYITVSINDIRFWANPRELEPAVLTNLIPTVKSFINGYEAGVPEALQVAADLVNCYRAEYGPEKQTKDIMDFARWHLVRAQRFSVPSQVADAVEDLEWLVAHQKKTAEKWREDGLIFLYLAVALTKRGGRDHEAHDMFNRCLRSLARVHIGPRDMLWARAFFSRLLRRQGLVKEADTQEEWIRRRVREELPTGLGGRRLLLPNLLDDGETTNSIVERIGWDYFRRPEYTLSDGTHLVFGSDGVLMKTWTTGLSQEDERTLRQTYIESFKGGKQCAIVDCHVQENLKKCGLCLKAMYCSKEHQALAWKSVHKANCKLWKELH